jgi:hypothetical protein
MAANEPWRPGRWRAMLTALADNAQPWRYTAEVGEGGDCTVGYVPRHGSSSAKGAASMSGKACGNADQWRGTRLFRLSLTVARHFSVCCAPRQNRTHAAEADA